MSKAQNISTLAGKLGITKTAARVIYDTVGQVIFESLEAKGEATLFGLGKAKVSAKPSRNGRNPRTGAPVLIPERNVVRLRPSKFARAQVNPAA